MWRKELMIPNQLLVGALAVEHHLDVVCRRKAKDVPLRKDTRRSERFILVPGNSPEFVKQIFDRGRHAVMFKSRSPGHLLRIFAFVPPSLFSVRGKDHVVSLALRSRQYVHQADNRR